MGVDRREFLKIAGYATLFGLGGGAAIDVLALGNWKPLPKASP